MSSTAPSAGILRARQAKAAAEASRAGIDALLVTPGADLRYLTGYDAKPLERLTSLVVLASGESVLLVPRLERLAAESSPALESGAALVTWDETDDPYAIVRDLVGDTGRIAVDNRMWAEKALRIQAAIPSTTMTLAGPVLESLRMVKDSAEVASLTAAGAAIDWVHSQVSSVLRPGVTERVAGERIAELILEAGHTTVDFVIVASGPNAASPHHDVSERILEGGDCIVVDIGGMMPDGYRSDCTRTYFLGQPDNLFAERYAVLHDAQRAAVQFARAGVSCEAIDTAARKVMEDAGLGELFIHRTGHGIGLESHEEPYIVAGNTLPVESGMSFSIEPGFYDEGLHGARIEDIVVATDNGCITLNNNTHDLVVI